MKFGRFFIDGNLKWGIADNGTIKTLSKDFLGGSIEQTGEVYAIEDARILSSVKPSKIIGVGLNYIEHINELNMEKPEYPLIFIKPPTTVIAHNETIIYPTRVSERIDYEGELSIVIGKKAKEVTEDEAKSVIFGYTIINDVTARDLQYKDGQWTRAKSFDTFSPLGPFIATDIDPLNLSIKTKLNGIIKQDSNTSDMLFNVYKLVSFVSQVMTLLPGDVIATGTPKGVGKMDIGDEVEITIENIGTLKNQVGGSND